MKIEVELPEDAWAGHIGKRELLDCLAELVSSVSKGPVES